LYIITIIVIIMCERLWKVTINATT